MHGDPPRADHPASTRISRMAPPPPARISVTVSRIQMRGWIDRREMKVLMACMSSGRRRKGRRATRRMAMGTVNIIPAGCLGGCDHRRPLTGRLKTPRLDMETRPGSSLAYDKAAPIRPSRGPLPRLPLAAHHRTASRNVSRFQQRSVKGRGAQKGAAMPNQSSAGYEVRVTLPRRREQGAGSSRDGRCLDSASRAGTKQVDAAVETREHESMIQLALRCLVQARLSLGTKPTDGMLFSGEPVMQWHCGK